jgi:hypothetical protein
MLETALLLTLISSWSSTLGLFSAAMAIATIAIVFYAIWVLGGILAVMFAKPIERFATDHGAHAI